jgi:pSer/pThr/pTyr-binding forkhead associated (FHA) protein
VLATDRVTVLGRHPDCDVVLAHVTVSRRHVEIRPVEDGLVLADLGSFNGTYRNSQPVDSAVLADGDDLAIGIFRVTFVTGDLHGFGRTPAS